jgi:hypothetical protein
VTTVGADTIKEIGDFLKGLVGESDPWPRHAPPGKPPDFLASDALGKRFTCTTVHGQRGNHFALLSFRQGGGGGVRCRVTYWPIHPDSEISRPVELGPIKLKGT